MNVNCQRCHQPIELDETTKQGLLTTGQTVVLEHAPGQCPGETPPPAPAAPVERFFEARLSFVEVFPDRHEHVELASFTGTATGTSAAQALAIGGPVMTDFAAKWEKLAPSFAFADEPATFSETPGAP